MSESQLAAVARAAAETVAPATTQPVASAPLTPDPAILSAARAEGAVEAAAAERGRCKAILTASAAAERTDLAHYFAFDTDMSAEQAIAALDKAPKAAAPVENPFLSAMRSEPNPNVGSGAASSSPNVPIMTLADRAAARYGVTANAAR